MTTLLQRIRSCDFPGRYVNWLKNYMVKSLWHWTEHTKRDVVERQLYQLKSVPRYTAGELSLFGNRFDYLDAASCLFMYQEIFKRQIYKFTTADRPPLILDCGANIGLSIIYFKQLYPDSRIVAFEPDRKIFEVLERNVQRHKFTDVELIEKALWTTDTSLEFMSEGADAGRLAEFRGAGKTCTVSATRLAEFLKEPVSLLKLDIEGAETEVLKDCQELLGNVEHLFVEYHSFLHQKQTLPEILNILSESGFRVHIHPSLTSPQPFYRRRVYLGMDLQLNIFAFRESHEVS